MKNLIQAFILLTLAVALPARAHEAPIRVVVLGEDSDRNAVSRSSESFSSLSFAKTSP